MSATGPEPARVAVIVKGYPRLSETFIAQEILGLERRGLPLEIWSLRHPTERLTHPLHDEITASVRYLPEYLWRGPLRVFLGLIAGARRRTFWRFVRTGWRDLMRDPTPNRIRRLGQALVLARELPETIRHLHVHYLHTPASVARYAAILTGRPWSFSAHAKDIWTTPAWELREKLADASWGVTCTRDGATHLGQLAGERDRVQLLYHGLDLSRFPAPPISRPPRDGTDTADPIRIVAVGRAVEKKGFDDLLRALAALPADLAWRFVHVGGGMLLPSLKAKAGSLGIAGRVAFLGPRSQPDIIALLRDADLFALPAKGAADGDRDGLPNVLMEAASQALPSVATRFGGIPEFLREGLDAELVDPGDWEGLSNALNGLARDPARRRRYGASSYGRLVSDFEAGTELNRLAALLTAATRDQARSQAALEGAPA